MTDYQSYYYVVRKGRGYEIFSLSYLSYDHFRFDTFQEAIEFTESVKRLKEGLRRFNKNEE